MQGCIVAEENDFENSGIKRKRWHRKTFVAVNLATAIPNSIYLDCDVEEPNGNLFLGRI